jgi:phenylalanyl-tRNA synthetase alpha chain
MLLDKDSILRELNEELASVSSLQDLEKLKSKYLGKTGIVKELLKAIKDIPPEERKTYGNLLNELKETVEELFSQKFSYFKSLEERKNLLKEFIDPTLPATNQIGSFHPITLTLARILYILKSMGFLEQQGPELEKEEYNFDMLNIPKYHPARDMQDTFYVNKGGYVLRTHTSPIQIRTMLSNKPPIYITAPGKVYRKDDDPTHSPMFFQVEGLAVDKHINLRQLKYVLDTFLQLFFNKSLKTRYRSSYFPFTEPSFEVDIQCVICEGSGCRVCKQTGWLEVMGCGMVHPNVLRNCDIDPSLYTGFAFGMGVERLAMLYYGIDNIKLFYENDVRFLAQFEQ